MTWQHDDLADDLANHLRSPQRMVWTDMQLGPSGSPRPDVFTLQRSYSKPFPTAYEVKISRSDLRSDTTSGKWQSYRKYAGAIIFAVPDGLCTVADIPEGCGLLVRKEQVWRYVRKPTLNPVDIPRDAWMKLLIDGVGRLHRVREPQPRRLTLFRECEAVRKRFGAAVEMAARDLASAQSLTSDLKERHRHQCAEADRQVAAYKAAAMERARKEVEHIEQLRRELCEWLGLNGEVSTFLIERRIAQLRAECSSDARVDAAERKLQSAIYALNGALRQISPAKEEAA